MGETIILMGDQDMSNDAYYKIDGALSYELDAEHTDSDLTRDEKQILDPFILGSKRVLHLCCGAGRHVFAFSGKDTFSMGIDISPFLIQQARKELKTKGWAYENAFIQGNILDLPLASNSVDGITLLGNSFTLFSRDKAHHLLKEVNRVRDSDGLFAMDIPTSGGQELVQKLKVFQDIAVNNFGKGDLHWERFFDPKRKIVTSIETFKYQNGCGSPGIVKHRICFQLYSVAEICSLLKENNMELFKSFTHTDCSGKYKGMLKNRRILIFK